METAGVANEISDGVETETQETERSIPVKKIVGLVVSVILVLLAQRDLRKRPAELVRGSARVWRVVALVGPGAVAYLLFGRRKVASIPVLDPIMT